MFLHQIFINDKGDLPTQFPSYTEFCTNELRRIYYNWEYKIWSNKEIKKFLQNNFDDIVFKTYEKIKPYSYKSDLARYCILKIYGGLYVDLNTRFINHIQHDENVLFAFRDYSLTQRRGWYVSTSIIYSAVNNNILNTCVDILIDNVNKNYYGNSPLDVTGPGVLGKAINLNDKSLSDCSGELHCLTPLHENKTLAFVQDGGNIVAFRKPNAPGDLTFFGFLGVNNYKTMWERKDIYYDT